MSLGARDLHLIRGPLTIAALMASLAVGSVFFGRSWEHQAQARHDAAASAADAAQAKADAAVADRANMAAYQPTFNALRQRSVIGQEQRLPWVEYFTNMSQAGNPVALTLQIAPRRPLEDPPATPEPLENLAFYASKLTLESKLLHDVDALRLLAKLNVVQGASILRQCRLTRASDGATALPPYLMQLHCEGDIITLDTPPAAGAQP